MKSNIKNITELRSILYHFYDHVNNDFILDKIMKSLNEQAKKMTEAAKKDKKASPIVNPFTNKSFNKG